MSDPEPRKNAPKTRGRPFAPGNPGRPKGARHKATVLTEQLLSTDIEDVVTAVVNAAKAGDMTAARIILDRLSPPRKGRPVRFEIPPVMNLAGLSAAFAKLVEAVATGHVTPEEAASVASLLEAQRKAIELNEINNRLAALEAIAEREKQ
jgi:hypothetical protein